MVQGKSKIKVCFAIPLPPPYGGIANWSVLMKQYMDTRKEEINYTIINTAPKSRATEGRNIWDRVVVSGFDMLRKRRELKNIIRKQDIDVFHMTTSGQLAVIRDILLLKLAKKYKIKTVYHLRFGRVPKIINNNTLEWKLMKFALSLADKVISIDNRTCNKLQTILATEKAVYIPNPIELNKLPGKCFHEKNIVIFLGWLVKEKGIGELLEAWQELSVQFPEWSLQFVGPYKEKYLIELKEKYSFLHVLVQGEKNHKEAMKLLNQSKIFVLPSYTEGFPNVILEAMGLEKAIIASEVGAIPDMLGSAGVIIKPQSSQSIKKSLFEMIKDNERRISLGKQAKQRVEDNYDISIIYGLYTSLWAELVTNEVVK